MFRRSRFSVRPNVGTAGRTAATSQDASSSNQEANETPKDVPPSSDQPTVIDNKPASTPAENPASQGDGNDQNGEGTSSSAALQRRKRFSIKPKVAPGRPSAVPRTLKSPLKAVSGTPISNLDKPTPTCQNSPKAAPQGLQSPRRRRPSEDSKQPEVEPQATVISSDSSGPLGALPSEDSPEQTHPAASSSKQLESTSGCQVKDVPARFPDKVPPSLPDKQATEISEKARTLVSSKGGLSLSPAAMSLSRLLNDPSDLQRLAKARKLRELLREELHKEKKSKRAKARVKEFTLDPAKMTMRDLIHYLPVSNPMTTNIEDPTPENETIVPPSPGREELPEKAQEPEAAAKIASPREEEDEDGGEEEQEEALMVPQVKVAEDGSLIIDEESLTVEVLRAKGPNPAQDRDPIFERGSTTTYSSFRKGTYSKPWSSEETDMFFLAISMVGTDFSMICQLFPHRARSEIKVSSLYVIRKRNTLLLYINSSDLNFQNKFKKEERENAWRIDKAFRERRKLDIEYFSKLLEKILEVQKTRKKLRSVTEKNSSKKKRKTKGKKAAKKRSDAEEEDEEDENEIPDLEGENEGSDGESPDSKPKSKRKRKSKADASTEEPDGKKNKEGEKVNDQDEAYIPEDAEAALPEDRANSDMSEKADNENPAAKNTTIKPAKLSRGRAPKPVLPLGRKWAKKPAPPATKSKDTESMKGAETESDGTSKEQINKEESPSGQASKRESANDEISSEEEEAVVQPPKPTRYGRVPKPIKTLNYPAKDDARSSASEATPASPSGSTAPKPTPKTSAKRGRSSQGAASVQESKKPKLVTLRASQSQYSDEDEEEDEEVEEEQPGCSSYSGASAFVPASLRSPPPVISEVEETMEELEILASMPDVLGISQDSLCPDASCERAQNETGIAEPCEHQLDLLVGVIDFLSSEHAEVSADESYNEAAQTLLAIGNVAHVSQSAQDHTDGQDVATELTLVSVVEPSQHLEEALSQPDAQDEESSVCLVEQVPETSENADNTAVLGDERTGSDGNPTDQLQGSSQTKRGRFSKVKPKPNLGQASRTALTKTQKEGSRSDGQSSETPSAAEEIPKMTGSSQSLSKEDTSCSEVNLADEPSGSREIEDGSGAAVSHQSTSENQSQYFSDSKLDATLDLTTEGFAGESPDEMLTSHVGTITSGCDSLVTPDTGIQETNMASAQVQQSSYCPAPCDAAIADLAVSQKEESQEAAASQSRKSPFRRVTPKPNLAHTSRYSKPPTEKDAVEKKQTPNPKLQEQTTTTTAAAAGTEPISVTSPEKSNAGAAPDLMPPLDLGSAPTPTGSTETKSDVGVVDQVISDQKASESQNTSPTLESTNEKTRSSPRSRPPDPLVHDSAAQQSQAHPGPSIDSVPVQEMIDHPTPSLSQTEERSVSRKEGSDGPSSRQTRTSRFQKPKPNLTQLSRTSHSTQQTSKAPGVNAMEERSTAVEEKAGTGVVGAVEPSPASDQRPSGNQNISGHGSDQQIRDSAVPETDSLPAPCATPVDLPATVKEDSDDASASQTAKSRFSRVRPKPNVALTSRTGRSKPQGSKDTEKNSTQNPEKTVSDVDAEKSQKSTPDLLTPAKKQETDSGVASQESGAVTLDRSVSESQFKTSKEQTKPTPESTQEATVTKDSPVPESQLGHGPNRSDSGSGPESSNNSVPCVTNVKDLAVTQKQEGNTASACCSPKTTASPADPKTDAGHALDSSSESERNAPQRKQRFAKVRPKPNLLSSPRTTKSKLPSKDVSEPSEMCSMDSSSNTDSEQRPLHHVDVQVQQKEKSSEYDSAKLRPTSSDKSAEGTDDTPTSSGAHSITASPAAEDQSVSTVSTGDTVEASSEQWSHDLGKPVGSDAQSQDASQQCSEPSGSRQTSVQNPSDKETDSADSSRSAPPTRRSRLVKPRPNLGRRSQPQQMPSSKQAKSGFDSSSKGVDASLSHKPVSEVQADLHKPLEGAVEQQPPLDSTLSDAGFLSGCLTPTAEQLLTTSQNESLQNSPGSSLGCLTQLPDNVTEQVPTDPDEPFFILSLTEIPVSTMGDVVTETPLQQQQQQHQSVPEYTLTAAGNVLPDVAEPIEESTGTSPVPVQDTGLKPAADVQPEVENPVDPHGSAATSQVKAKGQRKKQASNTAAVKEAEPVPSQDPEGPGPSVELEASDQPGRGADGVDIHEEPGEGGKDHVGSRSMPETQTTQSKRRVSSRTSSPPAKAASKGPKVKARHAAGKPSTPTPAHSTSHDVEPPEETCSASSSTSPTQTQQAPGSSSYAAEVSDFLQTEAAESSLVEEEPTNVSQYFLSDIFTEVEEEGKP
ncbi:uncharacterized protein V6R79_017057 [Siganus canaliculatus]